MKMFKTIIRRCNINFNQLSHIVNTVQNFVSEFVLFLSSSNRGKNAKKITYELINLLLVNDKR